MMQPHCCSANYGQKPYHFSRNSCNWEFCLRAKHFLTQILQQVQCFSHWSTESSSDLCVHHTYLHYCKYAMDIFFWPQKLRQCDQTLSMTINGSKMSHLEKGNPSVFVTHQVLIRAQLFSDISITRKVILQRVLKTELRLHQSKQEHLQLLNTFSKTLFPLTSSRIWM